MTMANIGAERSVANCPSSSSSTADLLVSAELPIVILSPPRRKPSTRPLRTYGRQATTDRDTVSPPTKKRKLSAEDVSPVVIEVKSLAPSSEKANEKENVDPLPKLPLPLKPSPPRGTILSFFKPVKAFPSSSASSSSCAALLKTSSDVIEKPEVRDIEPPSTPPSSPPVLTKQRKRRRLTTRPDVGLMSANAVEDEEHKDEDCIPRGENAREQVEAKAETQCDALRDVKTESLNASTAGNATQRTTDGVKKKMPWRKNGKKGLVQTTLNVRINPGPGYTICKECELLYNPLNETDKKDHVRTHAAWKRKQSKVRK
jgi:hypothetical protein